MTVSPDDPRIEAMMRADDEYSRVEWNTRPEWQRTIIRKRMIGLLEAADAVDPHHRCAIPPDKPGGLVHRALFDQMKDERDEARAVLTRVRRMLTAEATGIPL